MKKENKAILICQWPALLLVIIILVEMFMGERLYDAANIDMCRIFVKTTIIVNMATTMLTLFYWSRLHYAAELKYVDHRFRNKKIYIVCCIFICWVYISQSFMCLSYFLRAIPNIIVS